MLLANNKKGLLVVGINPDLFRVVFLRSKSDGVDLIAYDAVETQNLKEKAPADFIQNFLKKNAGISRDVIFSIADPQRVVVKQLTLPSVPSSEVVGAAKWQLADEAGFDLSKGSADWQLIREYGEGEAKKKEVMFVAAKEDIVEECLSIASQCRLNPVVITTSHFNYANILKNFSQSPLVSAVLDIDERFSTLMIYVNGVLNFVRGLPISNEKITLSLTETLFSEKGKIELTLGEAENIKNTYGIPENGHMMLGDHIQASHIISLIRPTLEALVRDLKFSFDYFSSRSDIERPLRIYLTGCGAHLKNLDKHLNKELGIDVGYLPLPENVKNHLPDNAPWTQENINQFSSLVAAAYPNPESIDLLPTRIKTQKAELIQQASLRMAAVIAAAVLFFSTFICQFQVYDYEHRLKNANRHLQTLGGIHAIQEKIAAQEALIAKIQENNVPADGLLKTVSNLIPQEIVLDEFVLNQVDHRLILRGFILGGENIAETILTNFMQRLEDSSFFSEVNLLASHSDSEGYKFEIQCELPVMNAVRNEKP